MKTRTIFLALLLAAASTGVAQKKTPAQPELESGTIESQMNYIIEKSSSFKDFQLIRKTSILKVKDNVMDSLKMVNTALVKIKNETTDHKAEVDGLKNQITTLEGQVAAANEQVDAISVFGSPVEKTLYNSMMWGTVILLLLVLVFFVFRTKSSASVTKKTKYQLDKIENEFETFRKKSLKKEQEIMRKLQDELNKNNP